MQEELFAYTIEEIEAMKQQLAGDVSRLADLEDERKETNKGYSDAIKVLKMQITAKARAIKQFKGSAQMKSIKIAEN